MSWQILLENNCRGSIFKWTKLQVGSLLILHTDSKKSDIPFTFFFSISKAKIGFLHCCFKNQINLKALKIIQAEYIYIFLQVTLYPFHLSLPSPFSADLEILLFK